MAAIMVLTAGSTGDVEPFAALAGRLGERGHSVTLAADDGFEPLAPGGGVEFAPIRADFQSLLPTPERKKPSLRDDVFPVIRGMLEDSWKVAESTKPQVIVAHDKTLAAPHLAEKLGIPYVRALTVPMLTPTREFPLPAMVHRDLGGLLNRASYRLVGLLSRPYSGLIRDWRSDSLGLAARGKPPAPAKTLYCYSPSLVPTPADWPRDTVATGYWLRDLVDGTPPVDAELESFVADGAQPVYIGFGSSVGPDPDHLGAVVGDAVRQAGVRALRLRRDGRRERAASVALPSRCRRRPSRRSRHDRGRPARGTSEHRLSLPGRPAFLGRSGLSRRRRARAVARQEARRGHSRFGDPHRDR
jgi:sterol 3beta-glucosyltransferase